MDRLQPWQALGLQPHEEEWCRLRLAHPDLSGTALVRMIDAYGSRTDKGKTNVAHNLKRNPAIQQRLRQLEREAVRHIEKRKRIKLSSKRVLAELTSIAFADLRQLVTVANGDVIVRDSSDWPDAAASAVQSVVKTPDGLKLTFHDKLISLGRLAKILKLLPQESATAHPGGLHIGKAVIYIPENGRPLQHRDDQQAFSFGDPPDPNPDHQEDQSP